MSPIFRAAMILRHKGYLVLEIREPAQAGDGLVLFCDPHTIKRGWNRNRPLGAIHVNDREAGALQDGREVERVVREAEADLMGAL